jgi:hypothetical protein
MNDRKMSVGGDATGNFNLGDNVKQGDVTVTPAVAAAKQDLLAQLAALREQLAEIGRTDALSRVDDLEEETTASEVDKPGGRKAFDRLKTALTGVSAVTGLLAGIEDQVRALFS